MALLLLFSCSGEDKPIIAIETVDLLDTTLQIPNIEVPSSTLNYNRNTSLWTLEDELYSGYAVSYYSDNNLQEKIGFLNGRKQNEAIEWYLDGHRKRFSNYHKGKLHGEKKNWSSDSTHILLDHFNYHLGKAHGVQKKWYPSGEIYKILNLDMGQEKGLQKAFRKNGVLYANYEAKDGRSYGLKKASLCYEVDKEQIQNKK